MSERYGIFVRSRKPGFKNIGMHGDTGTMVALQAIVTAITITLVLAATRLTFEIEFIDANRLDGAAPEIGAQATITILPTDS